MRTHTHGQKGKAIKLLNKLDVFNPNLIAIAQSSYSSIQPTLSTACAMYVFFLQTYYSLFLHNDLASESRFSVKWVEIQSCKYS